MTAYVMSIKDWSSDLCSSDLQPVADADEIVENPSERMFARHGLGLPHIGLHEAAPGHMSDPAADHPPVGRGHAEETLHQKRIDVEDDRAADSDQRGADDPFHSVPHAPSFSIGGAGLAVPVCVSAAPAGAAGANDTQRTVSQPCEVSRLPDRKDPTAMVPKTMKSLSAWTRVFRSAEHPTEL